MNAPHDEPRAPVVVVGAPDDEHVTAVHRELQRRGIETVLFDSFSYPPGARLTFGVATDRIELDGRPLARPRAVYLRALYLSPIGFGVDMTEAMDANWKRTLIVLREKGEMLMSLMHRWEALGVPIYNGPLAAEATRKPGQIARLAAAGLPVPETLWTNDPAAVRRFAAGREVIYKPIRGGAATQRLGADDLAAERLQKIENSAVCFQELLPGENLRVYVLDGRVLSAYQIDATELDYRGHETGVTRFPLDPALDAICVRAARELGLRFTGMDLKRHADGGFRILELNPSPMFLGFDEATGTDILGELANALGAAGGRPEC